MQKKQRKGLAMHPPPCYHLAMIHLRKTKIVATIGPSSSDEHTLIRMIEAGMNVARINCSHGTHEEYRANIEAVRRAAKKAKMPVAILLDLGGPKIRIGEFAEGKITLERGAQFTLSTKPMEGTMDRVFINYPKITKEVKPGMHIRLDDGKVDLEVMSVRGDDVHTKVISGGEIRSRRGVNIPDADLSIETITAKDLKDVAFGIKMDVDFVALSFVRNAKDIMKLRGILMKNGSTAAIVAKIETRQAVEDIDNIIAAARGIMVARGDLAVEVPKEEVPLIQKMIIRKCNAAGKAVITATQMLDSMASHNTPTRAEVNDVANAIFDGTDAVMLSGESAIGIHPPLAIQTMAHIALKVENSRLYHEDILRIGTFPEGVVDAVSSSVAQIVRAVKARAIVALTESGFTPRIISRHKPIAPILVITSAESTYRQLVLSYGCYPVLTTSKIKTMTDAIKTAQKTLKAKGFAQEGEVFVLVAGVPFGNRGGTNTLSVQEV